jgi:hypothetical protein
MLVEDPDTIGKNLCELESEDSVEVEFGTMGEIHCSVVAVSETAEDVHREIMLEADNGDRIIVEVELLQRTRPDELNHYENKAYIVTDNGRNPFDSVTDLTL